MPHKLNKYHHLLGTLAGIGDRQLQAHFGLYEHYVKKLDEIEGLLADADRRGADYSHSPYSELKRREAVALNGAVLHELYFENLGRSGRAEPSPAMRKALADSFGTHDRYLDDLKASAASTPGWVLTTLSRIDGKLHNYILFEHHIGLPVHQEVVLALDCWEHAYMIDHGTAKADYVAAFLLNVDWQAVERRFEEGRR